MTLFVYSNLSEAGKDYLKEKLTAGLNVIFRNELADSAQQPALQQADLVLGNPPASWLADVPNLRWWQLDSAGFDSYAHLSLTCPVTNMGDFFAWPCAETMVAGLLAFYRKIHELSIVQVQKRWIGIPLRNVMDSLRYKRVVILGAGTIGQAIARMLTGFDCSVQFMARTAPDAQLHSIDELKAALPTTDIVISTLPGTAKGFFDSELIAAMQPGSLFANVGRGSTVDEPALIKALQAGPSGNAHLAGAVLDVTATEPLPTDNPLWTLPNVILTQHTGGGQLQEEQGKLDQFLRNLDQFQQGKLLENQVELANGY